jgi:acetolactate synthase-1/2/3 large subunit
MRVVDAIARWFEVAGFKHYFGYAGGAVWPFLDALTDKPAIEGIQAKHESHAVHMADLYHRVSGRVAPVIVSKGPGLLNAVGACASAMHESSPVLIIAGGSTTHFLGKAGMQEIYYHGFEDAQNIFRPVCKGTWMLVRPDTTIEILNYALKTATSGRPGPVFVEVPYDIQLALVEGRIEAPGARAPQLNRPRADADNVQRIARMIAEAERPLLLAGGGVVRSGAAAELKAVAEKLNIPTVTTLPAKGMLPEDHPLSIGTLGRSGFVGARFSDNHTANWRKGSIYDVEQTKIVQVDLDYQEVGRNFPLELGLVSDAKLFLEDLAAAVGGPGNKKHQGWLERTQGFRAEWEEEIRPLQTAASAPTHPARLVHEVGKALPKDGRVYIDIGDVTQYAEAYMKICTPGAWQISPGMAEMGWASSGVPGAIAADGRPGVVLVGDGAFNMTSQVVASAVEYDLPAIWVILNNYELGIERKGMERSYSRSHPWCHFVRKDTGKPYNPDYVALARAYGAEGARIDDPAALAGVLAKAFASRRPWVIDVPIDLSVGSYFTKGIDRAYPDKWAKSYPSYNLMRNVES